MAALRDAYGHIAPVIHHRVKIAEAAEGGGTITETAPGSMGAAEVAAVWRRARAELWGSAGPRAGLAARQGGGVSPRARERGRLVTAPGAAAC